MNSKRYRRFYRGCNNRIVKNEVIAVVVRTFKQEVINPKEWCNTE